MIEKVEDITEDQMAMFMVNTLAKALEDWTLCATTNSNLILNYFSQKNPCRNTG